jgi:hypothetical protein
MASEYLLDLYYVFVEVIFGHFLLAIIALAAIFAVICLMFRVSGFLTLIITILFLMVMMIGFFGSIAGIMVTVFSFSYCAYAIIRWVQGSIAS